MSFLGKLIERITGPKYDDFLTEKGRKRLEGEERKKDAIIHRAWESSPVQELAREIGLTEDHLRDLYCRFQVTARPRLGRKAINDVRLIRWYYEHGGKEKRLDANAMIELFSFAESGRLE